MTSTPLYDKLSAGQVFDKLSTWPLCNKLSTQLVSVDELLVQPVSVSEVSAQPVFVSELSAQTMSVSKVSAQPVFVSELSAQRMSSDELSAQSSGDLSTQPLADELMNTHMQVSVPKIVQVYNRYMGDVYLLDSLIGLGLYRTRIRLKKWYFLPLGGSRSCKCVAAVSKSIWRETAIVPRPEPCSDVRLDDFGRWPMRCCKRQHFKRNGFKQLSGVVCYNCRVTLCFTCKNMLYHT